MATIVDPMSRCPHCFEESEGLCFRCRKTPLMVFTKAFLFESFPSAFYLVKQNEDVIVSFLICGWARLDWQMPDLVIAAPTMEKIALQFSEKIEKPCLFLKSYLFSDVEKIEEDLVLLILDRGSGLEDQRKMVQSLASTFPKRGYLLSLFVHDTFNF